MKTPEETKKGLEACRADECHGHHTGCPYDDDFFCMMHICGDALAYIEQLEERIDLMMIQMHGDCGCCKHRNAKKESCRSCLNEEDSPYWKYEGLPVIKL